jgi:hypothetical protein
MANTVQANSWVLYLIIIFCLVFVGMGVWMLVKLFRNLAQAKQSEHWLTTSGKVVSSELDSQANTDDEGYSPTTYIARVCFAYEISGVSYQGDCINFNYGMRTSNLRIQQSIVEQYPEGSTVTVYYDPEKPNEAVLERKVNGAFTTILVSAIFILIGIIVAVMSLGVNPPAFLRSILGN